MFYNILKLSLNVNDKLNFFYKNVLLKKKFLLKLFVLKSFEHLECFKTKNVKVTV